jgi:hypothetical protein
MKLNQTSAQDVAHPRHSLQLANLAHAYRIKEAALEESHRIVVRRMRARLAGQASLRKLFRLARGNIRLTITAIAPPKLEGHFD